MLESISKEIITSLKSQRLTLNHLWLLEQFYLGTGKKEYDELSYQALERKGLLLAECITEEGKTFYSSLNEGKELPKSQVIIKFKTIKNDIDEWFEKWWSEFPSSDGFKHKGHTFNKTRGLKTSAFKEKCKKKFSEIIAKGEYTGSQLYNALISEVLDRKERSVKTSDNKLAYMSAVYAYLNQAKYETYIDDDKTEEEKTSSNNEDIYV